MSALLKYDLLSFNSFFSTFWVVFDHFVLFNCFSHASLVQVSHFVFFFPITPHNVRFVFLWSPFFPYFCPISLYSLFQTAFHPFFCAFGSKSANICWSLFRLFIFSQSLRVQETSGQAIQAENRAPKTKTQKKKTRRTVSKIWIAPSHSFLFYFPRECLFSNRIPVQNSFHRKCDFWEPWQKKHCALHFAVQHGVFSFHGSLHLCHDFSPCLKKKNYRDIFFHIWRVGLPNFSGIWVTPSLQRNPSYASTEQAPSIYLPLPYHDILWYPP